MDFSFYTSLFVLIILICVNIASPPDKRTALLPLKSAKADRLLLCIKPLNVIEYLIPSRQGKSFAHAAEIYYDYAKSIDLHCNRYKILEKLFTREVG